jgi:hypothetical protein
MGAILCVAVFLGSGIHHSLIREQRGSDRAQQAAHKDLQCGLQADAEEVLRANGNVWLVYRLRWVGGGHFWFFRRPVMLQLTFYDGQGRVVGRAKRMVFLDDDFMNRKARSTATPIVIKTPPAERFITIELPGSGLVTKRLRITSSK